MTDSGLAQQLAAAWQRQLGTTVHIDGLRRLSAGASSASYVFTVTHNGVTQDCILQTAGAGGSGDMTASLDKTTQARVQQAAAAAGVKTPPVLLIVGEADGLPPGFVSPKVAGETLGGRIVGSRRLAAARARLTAQCAEALAGIHAVDTAAVDFLPLQQAKAQLQQISGLYRNIGDDVPHFDAAFAWLGAHLPDGGPPCLVHGDFRTGNFLVDENGLAGVLDWELAHLGDAHEDIGWLCMRSWRFGADDHPVGGFGQREDFYRHYETASGRQVDRAAVRFWQLMAAVKWGVICQWFAFLRRHGKSKGIEPMVIGRRVSEVELQIVDLIEHGED